MRWAQLKRLHITETMFISPARQQVTMSVEVLAGYHNTTSLRFRRHCKQAVLVSFHFPATHWPVLLTDTCTKRISCTIVLKITSNGAVIDIRNVRGFMIAQHVANTSKQAHGQRFRYTNHSRNFFERFITIGSRSYHFKIAWPARPPGTSLSTSQILNTRTIAHVLPFEGITTFDSDI